MKSRRHVIMFQSRFAPLVERGEKPHTIRPKRVRPIRVGDTLDLRMWLGKPYRTTQRKLREAVCTRVVTFRLHVAHGVMYFRVDGALLTETAMHLLAQRDGFYSALDMAAWFERTHGLPFKGQLIEWAV